MRNHKSFMEWRGWPAAGSFWKGLNSCSNRGVKKKKPGGQMCVRAEAAGRNWDDRSSLGWVTPPRLRLILEALNRGVEPFGGGSGAGFPAQPGLHPAALPPSTFTPHPSPPVGV